MSGSHVFCQRSDESVVGILFIDMRETTGHVFLWRALVNRTTRWVSVRVRTTEASDDRSIPLSAKGSEIEPSASLHSWSSASIPNPYRKFRACGTRRMSRTNGFGLFV